MKIFAVGDIVGSTGIRMLREHLPGLKKQHGLELTIVNGENAAMLGILPEQADQIFDAGTDVITLGNHAFSRKEIGGYMQNNKFIIRPLNMAPGNPGEGFITLNAGAFKVLIVNLIGRCFMDFAPDNPFFAADKIIDREKADLVIVDFHAQATSEKLAMAHYLDGRAGVMFGTHTHVQTADEFILPGGLGYISDLGMTGPAESILGVQPHQSINYFLGQIKERYQTAPGPGQLNGCVFTIGTNAKCTGVQRVFIRE